MCGNRSLSQPGCRTCWLVGLGQVPLPRAFNKGPALLSLCPEGLREKSFPSAQSSGVVERRVSSGWEERVPVCTALTQSPACLRPAGSSPGFLCLFRLWEFGAGSMKRNADLASRWGLSAPQGHS